jgi:hypothetical protein
MCETEKDLMREKERQTETVRLIKWDQERKMKWNREVERVSKRVEEK